MSQIFRLSDEEYATLAAYAAQRDQTPEILFLSWLQEVKHQSRESFDDPRRVDRRDEYLAAIHIEDHAD